MRFATGPDPTELLTLPWSTPLEEWPTDRLVSLLRASELPAARSA